MYSLLNSYRPDGLKEFASNGLLVWLREPISETPEKEWPLTEPTLPFLTQSQCSTDGPIVLDSSAFQTFQARQILPYGGTAYTSEEYQYEVFYRYAWPYEIITNDCKDRDASSLYFPKLTDLPESISCTPEDGVIQFP